MQSETELTTTAAVPVFSRIQQKISTAPEVYGKPSKVAAIDGSTRFVQLENESGTGEITIYHVFSGVDVIYNDMHLGYCNKNPHILDRVIEINHCAQGRYECSFDDSNYCYMTPGDMSIVSQTYKKKDHCFPGRHYHGLTILIKPEEIGDELQSLLERLEIDLAFLWDKISGAGTCHIMRANERIEHVFSELYHVREEKRSGYLKIKLLEILFILSDLQFDSIEIPRVCLTRKQADAIKGIHDFMIEHIMEHYTLEELSQRFDLSLSLMKKNFKEVYGNSIYAYLRNYRMQMAEQLLQKADLNISQVAETVGYANPAKFSAAFKKAKGIAPKAFQKMAD